ncbi:MAG: hypothetical protein ACP5T3_01695 [Candidatus Micrarchaeia archaeon]
MASAGKALLGGIILGILVALALETLVALAFLSSQGVKNPFQFVGSLIKSLPTLSSINMSALSSLKGINIGSLKNLSSIMPAQQKQKDVVNVTSVYLYGVINVSTYTTDGTMRGSLDYNKTTPGFIGYSNSTSNYTVSIPDYSQFAMNVTQISVNTKGFEMLYLIPKLPRAIRPGSSENFTVILKLPSGAYSGPLQIGFSGSISK